MRTKFFVLCFALLGSVASWAQHLRLGELFNEGMVLQQSAKVAIWGDARPGEQVSGDIQGRKFKAVSDASGKWMTSVADLKAGGPFVLTINSDGESLQLKEVYVGEVWLAGGQSNMAWTLEKSEGGPGVISRAKNKNVRFVMVPARYFEGDKVRGDMGWKTATSENAGPMSGVAYFFAQQLQAELQVPVGVICCYKGGTAAEVWMDREEILKQKNHAPIVRNYENYLAGMGDEKYQELFGIYEKKLKSYYDSVKGGFTAVRPVEPMGEKHYKRPYGLYNTMLKRVMPYTVKGVIWYQGEANAPRAWQYRTLFPALIREWRHDFRNPGMPFLFVQLSNYDHPAYGVKPAWAELREAQLHTWQTVKNTAMVASIDVGNKNDIHPRNKKPVGERLAAAALNLAYGQAAEFSGPVYKSVKIKGNKAVLSFDHVGGGLKADGMLMGFTVCGKDGVFVPADARIAGNRVEVSSVRVDVPVAVRYGWSNWSEGNLFSREGLPALPFRTDSFALGTAGVTAPVY